MFRLVVCADDRETVGPECLSDVQDHVAFGFAANLQGDRGISAWKGLVGGYLSQLFVKPLSEVNIGYTEREFRDLDSVPLRMTDIEKRQFIHRALEIYWGYKVLPSLPAEAPRDLKHYLDDTQALSRRRWVAAMRGQRAQQLRRARLCARRIDSESRAA